MKNLRVISLLLSKTHPICSPGYMGTHLDGIVNLCTLNLFIEDCLSMLDCFVNFSLKINKFEKMFKAKKVSYT